jgi:hypothetical protein
MHPDGREELVSEHPDFQSGWEAGTHAVTVKVKDNAYIPYDRSRCVAKFGYSRLLPRVDARPSCRSPGPVPRGSAAAGDGASAAGSLAPFGLCNG